MFFSWNTHIYSNRPLDIAIWHVMPYLLPCVCDITDVYSSVEVFVLDAQDHLVFLILRDNWQL